jgi:hypothetical protein
MRDKSVRCDNCGSEAWVTVSLLRETYSESKYLKLAFCAHHYNKNSVMLHSQGWELVQDERELINAKPSVSANV